MLSIVHMLWDLNWTTGPRPRNNLSMLNESSGPPWQPGIGVNVVQMISEACVPAYQINHRTPVLWSGEREGRVKPFSLSNIHAYLSPVYLCYSKNISRLSRQCKTADRCKLIRAHCTTLGSTWAGGEIEAYVIRVRTTHWPLKIHACLENDARQAVHWCMHVKVNALQNKSSEASCDCKPTP